MSKINEVWHGVKTRICPAADFMYWYEVMKELEYWDPCAGQVCVAKLVMQDDGEMAVEVIR